MATTGRFFDQPFLFRVVNVGWDTGGWGVLAIDMPQNQALSNPHGWFPIGPFSAGDTITPNTQFVQEDGQLDKFNWMWFAQIQPLPPKLSQLYDVPDGEAKTRWIIEAYINAPAERNEDQDEDFEFQTEGLNAALGYSFVEDQIGSYIRVDPETTEDPGNPWSGTGDYPVPQTIYKKLYGSTSASVSRQYRYWYRYDPLDPPRAKRDEVRLTYILNFAGGPPAFEEPEPFFNDPGQADEHLPVYDLKFKLDIYDANVVLTVDDTTITGPDRDRTYSDTRSVPYTESGNIVVISSTGFVD